jgi:hypothetical protein
LCSFGKVVAQPQLLVDAQEQHGLFVLPCVSSLGQALSDNYFPLSQK